MLANQEKLASRVERQIGGFFGNITVEGDITSMEKLAYCLHPYTSAACVNANTKFRIICLTDQTEVKIYAQGSDWAVESNKHYTNAHNKKKRIFLVSSDSPHLGALRAIRSTILTETYNRNGTIFHAAAAQLSNGEGIVFSTSGIGEEGSKKGKTTSLLSITNECNASVFCNDELLISGGEFAPIPFPNGINLDDRLIKVLGLDKHEHLIRGKHIDMTTLERTGYKTTNSLPHISKWFIVDLAADNNFETWATKLNDKNALMLFLRSIFEDRMRQAKQGSFIQSSLSNVEPISDTDYTRAAMMFYALRESGTEFFTLSGSIYPECIRSVINCTCQP